MAQPVQADCLKAWVAEQDLERPTRCRIPFADDRKVGPNLIKHGLAALSLRLIYSSSRAGKPYCGASVPDQWLTRPTQLPWRSSLSIPSSVLEIIEIHAFAHLTFEISEPASLAK